MITTSKSHIRELVLAILIGLIVSLLIAGENVFVLCAIAGLILILPIFKRPELTLAVLFNGTLIYFYTVYKSGFEPYSLLTGGFYASLVIFFLIGEIVLITQRPQNFKLGLIDVLFIFFFCLVFLNYFMFSTDNESAFKKISYAPLLAIAPYFGTQLLPSKERINMFFNYSVISAAVLIVPALYELFYNPVFSGSGRFSMYLFSVKGDNPIMFGITFSIVLLISSIWILETRKFRLVYLFLIISSMFFILRSGSRGAVISVIVTMLFYFFIIGRLRFKTKIFAVLLASILAFGTYKLIPDSTINFYKYSFSSQAQTDKSSSVYQRITMWKQAIIDFKENPILGVGMGNSVGGSGMPHNIFLEIAAELGILGLLLFLAICYLTITSSLKFINKEEKNDLSLLMKISILLFIYSLTEAMFSGSLTSQVQVFMSVGLVVSILKLKKINSDVIAEQVKGISYK